MIMSQPILHSPVVVRLASVLQHFPPVTYAFAYGSGAHHQPGLYDSTDLSHLPTGESVPDISLRSHSGSLASTSGSLNSGTSSSLYSHDSSQSIVAGKSVGNNSDGAISKRNAKPMIDFILAVDNAHQWHEQNLKRNPEHYSWVGKLGPGLVCGIAEAVGVGVHFNPLVQLNPQTTIKYGVVDAAVLREDLSAWTSLYLAGRMHKPISSLTSATPALGAAQATNLRGALAASLLLLPPRFTEMELMRCVVGLSYRGDVRLVVGAEDPHKVSRIVEGSWGALVDMYLPILQTATFTELGVAPVDRDPGPWPAAGGPQGGRVWEWRRSGDPAAQVGALQLLPPGLLQEMAVSLGYRLPLEHLSEGEATQAEVLAVAVRRGAHTRLVADSVAAIVRRSSMYQAAAGLLAAGGGKAATYMSAKMSKALRPLLTQAGRRG